MKSCNKEKQMKNKYTIIPIDFFFQINNSVTLHRLYDWTSKTIM